MTQNLLPPSGTRDFLPEDAAERARIFDIVKKTFQASGFAPFDTPCFERIETLQGKYGEEGEKLIFKILKRGEKAQSGDVDYALRYDLTVPTMRAYAGNRHKLPGIFKRYQMAPVWRADRPGKGRFREFYQCDVDIFGSSSPLADFEVIATLSSALKAVGLPDFCIKLNSRKLLKGMMEAYKIQKQHEKQILIALDKMDKIGLDGVTNELSLIETPQDLLDDLASGEFATRLMQKAQSSEMGTQGVLEIEEMLQNLSQILSPNQFTFDPLMVRGLDYYTGIIFEIGSTHFAGSIAAGGRYDALSETLANIKVPVCGGSLGIERILMLLENKEKPKIHGPQLYLTLWDTSFKKDIIKLATDLRQAGFSAEIDLTGDKLGGQLKMADKRNAQLALIFGPDEKEKNIIAIKDLRKADQIIVPLGALISTLKEKLHSE
jgi:histidyl-tRNA synthetase